MLLFQTSREVKFYFQHFTQFCFYFFEKKKKENGGHGPLRPLPLLWHCVIASVRNSGASARRGLTVLSFVYGRDALFKILQSTFSLDLLADLSSNFF